MPDFLDLPKFLSVNKEKGKDVKILCLMDRQIDMPDHLKYINNSSNLAALVDIIGIDIEGKKYLMRGKAVVVLGPRAFEPVPNGKKVLVLNGNARLKENDYVEVTLMYPTRNGSGFSLYATKTVYRDIQAIRNAYPDLMKSVDKIAQMGWNLDAFYSTMYIPMGYRVACGGCYFPEVSESEKFVYKNESEYKKTLVDTSNKMPFVSYRDSSSDYTPQNIERGHIKCRNTMISLPKKFEDFNSILHNSELKVSENIEKLGTIPTFSDILFGIDYTYNQMKTYWRFGPNSDSATGRALFKSVIEHLYPEFKTRYAGSKHYIDDVIDDKNGIEVWYNEEVPDKYKDNILLQCLANGKEEFYIGIIDYLLGFKCRLYSAYKYGSSLGKDVYNIIRFNPYYLSLIDNRLSIEDLDRIALLFNIDFGNSEVQRFRNVAYMHHFVINPNNDKMEDNTIIPKWYILKNISIGYVISSACYRSLQTNNSILTDKLLNNLFYYLKKDLKYEDFSLPKDGWYEIKIKGISKYTRPFGKTSSNEDIIKDYLNSGLGIELSYDGEPYIMDYSYAKKEQFIINKLYKIYNDADKPYLDKNNIEACIRGFERTKAQEWNMPTFKLEDRQADAVRMLSNPVMCLTGPAGSGKTTTAEAILYGLQALLGIEEQNIMFCAPTGKAAQRLKEIVKKPTQTIHSLFTIGSESYNVIDEDKVDKKYDIKVLIVDESSMINLELMYNMLMKVTNKTRIIFMGDIEQLPPIGAGKPFFNILGFLPCIVLDVTKRAAANSGITKNAEEIIYHSENIVSDLQQYDDFRILETPMNKIVDLVAGIVNYHLGRAGEKRVGDSVAASRVLQSLDVNLRPDDIQVVSPVKKKHSWGTNNLNIVLQDVFNPRNSSQKVLKSFLNYEIDDFSKEKTPIFDEYRIGDRVIHTENDYNKMNFMKVVGSVFRMANKSGVMNGDVGKVSGIFMGSELSFVDKDGNKDDNLRQQFASDDNVIYLAVDYEGIDTEGNNITYTVFYSSFIIENSDFDEITRRENCYIVDSNDLKKLELAYALTVHKIQGSQAKLIICVMYPIRYTDFISRNMIYTAITRAVEGVYLVGDVLNRNSVIAKGRKVEQTSQRLTVSDKIFLGGNV